MKKIRIIVLAMILIAAILIVVVYLSKSGQNKKCDDVKKVTIPTDVIGAPDDIYTGDSAVRICKELGPNPITEGGRAKFEY